MYCTETGGRIRLLAQAVFAAFGKRVQLIRAHPLPCNKTEQLSRLALPSDILATL